MWRPLNSSQHTEIFIPGLTLKGYTPAGKKASGIGISMKSIALHKIRNIQQEGTKR